MGLSRGRVSQSLGWSGSTALQARLRKGFSMRHLGSALLLGILLAMVLGLAAWSRPPQSGGMPGKISFKRTLNQLDLIEDRPAP